MSCKEKRCCDGLFFRTVAARHATGGSVFFCSFSQWCSAPRSLVVVNCSVLKGATGDFDSGDKTRALAAHDPDLLFVAGDGATAQDEAGVVCLGSIDKKIKSAAWWHGRSLVAPCRWRTGSCVCVWVARAQRPGECGQRAQDGAVLHSVFSGLVQNVVRDPHGDPTGGRVECARDPPEHHSQHRPLFLGGQSPFFS